MALVISFVPDPLKAVREMARVVRPGGTVATYMWDGPGGGLPLEPVNRAMRSIGVAPGISPGFEASRQDRMRAVWQEAGLQSIEERVIRIRVVYPDFDDFCDSNLVPVGPVGKVLAGMSPAMKDQLKAQLRKDLPQDSEGRISYEPFANAVKGRVPG